MLALALTLLIAASSLPIFTGTVEFTGDDYYYVVDNPLVTSPDAAALMEIWRRPMKIEYFPVTITSYAIEHHLWGGTVPPYHLTNLLLFLALGLVSWSLAWRLNRVDREGTGLAVATIAAFSTAFCLAHPLNVESVASVSNRKELLCGLFSLLALRFHLAGNRRWTTIMATVVCMVLAQLSKGSAVILPLLLFLADQVGSETDEPWIRRIRLPLAVSLVAGLIFAIQFRVAVHAGVVDNSVVHSLTDRFGGIVRSFNAMLGKFIWPVGLSYDYDLPWPNGLPSASEFILPLLLLFALLWLFCTDRCQTAFLALLALVPLLPYVNIIPLRHNVPGQMVIYDHYLLLSIMLFIPLLTRMLRGVPHQWQTTVVGCVVVIALLLTGYDLRLYGYWKNRETLYKRIVALAPRMPKGYLFLGKSYNEQGRYRDAIEVLGKVPELENWFPTFLEVYRELGNAYAYSGRFSEAEVAYRRYLEYQPNDRASLQNLSASLMEQHKYREAITVILQWLSYYPDEPDARHNLKACEQALGGPYYH